ncbi:MAG TPA: RNA polymerase sigma factor [Pyrinomonadaceae bacterium]|nr:RNA polymerase sigma factor [Pyrinomonadaceae bacterium]
MEDSRFNEIYDETAQPLWRYVARISGSATSADDILQETYLSFLRSSFRSDDINQTRPYLYKIATNLVYKRFHKSRHEAQSEVDEAAQDKTAFGSISESTEMSQIFSRLNERERALLWLAYVEGYEHKEIAEILNINSLSVRVLLFRARRQLAAKLEVEGK